MRRHAPCERANRAEVGRGPDVTSAPLLLLAAPLPREQLEASLSEWGLIAGECSVRRLVSAKTLDALYDRMDLEAAAPRSAAPADPAPV